MCIRRREENLTIRQLYDHIGTVSDNVVACYNSWFMVLNLKTHSESPEVVLKELPTAQVIQRSRHQPKCETDGVKVENDEDSEVLTLRALLDEKAVEMARREAETRLQIRKLQKEKENLAIENEGFKQQIRQLQHELTRKRNGYTSNVNLPFKKKSECMVITTRNCQASSSLNTPSKIRVKSENSRRLDEAPISVRTLTQRCIRLPYSVLNNHR